MPTVVVLPLVPVTASHCGAPGSRSRQASSTSPQTSMPGGSGRGQQRLSQAASRAR